MARESLHGKVETRMSTAQPFQDARHRDVPPEFETRGMPGYAWPAVPTTLGASVRTLLGELLENEWRSPDEIRSRQMRQLRALLQFAEQNSPFYAKRIRSCGLNPGTLSELEDIRRMPVLKRREVQDQFEEIRARQLPPGTQSAGDLTTSGSTGSPVKLLATTVTSLMWAVCNARDQVWSGVNPRWSLVSIRDFSDKMPQACSEKGAHMPNWGGTTAQVFATGPCHLIDISQDVEAQLDFILSVNPDYILSYPSALEILAGRLLERGASLSRLKLVQTIGEVLAPEVRENIQTGFNARVWDLYSCVEVGYVASDCPSGEGYHVHEENVLLEVLDENDEPCGPGQAGRVVLTALTNYATPVIRYDVGDYAVPLDGPCPCGRGLKRLEKIIGRQRGQLLLPDGRVKFSSPLSRALRDAGALRQFKVIQHERDRVEILIVPMEGFGEAQREKITEAFQSYLGFPIKVSFTSVPEIERTPAGKYLDFVCNAT